MFLCLLKRMKNVRSISSSGNIILKNEQGKPTVEYAREMSASNTIEITGAAHMHVKGEKFMHLRASQPGKNSTIAAISKAKQKVIVTGHPSNIFKLANLV